ncbi:MAG: ABC transporter ATP-binding protein [Alphaproteobacteria bacterium]|jgi:glycerol transport system ATP-binding protein|nr:ABC transporter ATP-binding protein [Alphaproteobacteria bacterium]
MAKIGLRGLKHSYLENPVSEADWALKDIDLEWSDGGAYALLGPSGCGKTTLLNIISGLLTPSRGRVWFGEEDVTETPPDHRNIAQVFQFPVVYDTMTVHDNLAFPLRNRGFSKIEAEHKVIEIAQMLDLEDMLPKRASGLTADSKQKISLGRGLIRADVNAILFDEPLTVIDPHLKWILRSKLKELHQKVGSTMIYVTHDQTEALTFADQVVVMHEGAVVQVGTPVELFETPRHTFVGHFIGSPGMNVLPCTLEDGGARFSGHAVETRGFTEPKAGYRQLELGVRPEFVSFADDGIPVKIVKVSDTGRHRIVETRFEDVPIRLLVPEGEPLAADDAHVRFDPGHTQVYADGWMVDGGQP